MKCVRNATKLAWLSAPKAVSLSYCFCPDTSKSCKIFGLTGLRIRKTAFRGRVQAMYSPLCDMTEPLYKCLIFFGCHESDLEGCHLTV